MNFAGSQAPGLCAPSTSGASSLYNNAPLGRRSCVAAQSRALVHGSWQYSGSLPSTSYGSRDSLLVESWRASPLTADDQRPGHASRRRLLPPVLATKGGGSSGSSGGSKGSAPPPGGKGGEESKADFSALWAQRFKQFFSARRQYLAQADASPEEEAKRKDSDKKIAADRAKLAELKAEYVKDREAYLEVESEATIEAMKAARVEFLKQQNASAEEIAAAESATYGVTPLQRLEDDVTQARGELRTNPRVKIALGVARTRDLVKAAILFPITSVMSLHAAWRSVFDSQGYENFLMSEGERMWFWRNRMENERWFWEKFAWDRILLPILCAVSYQLITPPNFLFAVLVPLALSLWQHGHLPALLSVDMIAIAYLGFYKKCWPHWSSGLGAFVFGW